MAECYIWNTPAEFKLSTGDYAIVNSPRTGGLYRAVGTILNSLYDIPLEQRKRLTSWLVEQRRAGIEIPEISSYTLEAVESRSLMSFTDKINAALLFFGKHITKIGQNLVMRPSDPLMLTLVAETE